MAPSSTAATAVLDGLPGIRAWQEDFYRDLHRHPELSHQEHRTAAKVAETLAGYRVHTGIGGTGVIGILDNGPGPTVLLRADMDALPVLEDTGLPYASSTRATDATGHEVPVMHACGHDAHVTALLGAARLMADGRSNWGGTLVALFQPAEETGEGARGMVDDGLRNFCLMSTCASVSTSCPSPPARSACTQVRSWRLPTACGSPCTAGEVTDRCRRRPSIRSSSPR